ncbi:hypothetical protein [Streptomyces microflavus]
MPKCSRISLRPAAQRVNYYGSVTVDYDRELVQLDEHGHRPLRNRRRRH